MTNSIKYFAIALLLAACQDDETISGYLPQGSLWQLVEMDGAAFVATATITFPAEGQVTGGAPCNRYTATQTAPYPWVSIEAIALTRRACPELAAEQRFVTALGEMTLAETSDTVLILSDEAGRRLVFERTNPDG